MVTLAVVIEPLPTLRDPPVTTNPPVIVVTASVDAPTTFNVPPSEAAAPTLRDPPVTTNPPVIVVTASVDAPTTFSVPPTVVLERTEDEPT